MEIIDLINDLKTWNVITVNEKDTCDTVKFGSVNKTVRKVAITMFATVDVLNKVNAWGADFLIVHEPLFYNHMDQQKDYTIVREKKKIIADSGLTIFRFHDYAHAMEPDMICAGEIKYAGLKGEIRARERLGVTSFVLQDPLTAEELAEKLKTNLHIDNIRMSGSLNKKGNKIACCFGSAGELIDLYENYDFILAGEISEWREFEMARDAALLGYNKAILVLGHEASERAGMMYMRDLCVEKYPNLEFQYFESGSFVVR